MLYQLSYSRSTPIPPAPLSACQRAALPSLALDERVRQTRLFSSGPERFLARLAVAPTPVRSPAVASMT